MIEYLYAPGLALTLIGTLIVLWSFWNEAEAVATKWLVRVVLTCVGAGNVIAFAIAMSSLLSPNTEGANAAQQSTAVSHSSTLVPIGALGLTSSSMAIALLMALCLLKASRRPK